MVNFFNDIVGEEDSLGYKPYIEAFNYILKNSDELISPPIVFGIHGKWGVGKTTFMNLIKSRLEKEKKFYTIEINPWEYGIDQNFITIFLAQLYNEVQNQIKVQGKDSGNDFIKALFKPLKVSLNTKPISVEYDFDKFSLDQQKQEINNFISENFAMKESISYILNHDFIKKKKIVIFIDDLDRCNVDKVMEVIESIKLILNSKNCIFFLGCDVSYLESALANKYEKFIKFSKENSQNGESDFAREYLEKIIQIPFYIPAIDDISIKNYIDSILGYKKSNIKKSVIEEDILVKFKNDLKDKFASDLIISTGVNPRRIKRILNLTFLNYVFLKFKNIEKNNVKINTKLLVLICVIREVYAKFYRENMSSELSAKFIFEYYFKVYLNKDEIEDKEENEEKEELNDNIYLLFELYFKYRKLKEIKELSKDIEYVSLYVSVNNLNLADNINDSEWGKLTSIRSEITGKKLSVFFKGLKGNSSAENFIYWFFNDIYFLNKRMFTLGIVKNVNIYIGDLQSKIWIFKFDFDKKMNQLSIIFKWRGEESAIAYKLNSIIKSDKYDNENLAFRIDEETTASELDVIKDDIKNIIEDSKMLYLNSDVAATK